MLHTIRAIIVSTMIKLSCLRAVCFNKNCQYYLIIIVVCMHMFAHMPVAVCVCVCVEVILAY